MDTRILHTKMFRDSYIRSLTDTEYRIFTYFVFNPHISQLGIYELEPEELEFDLPTITPEVLETIKQKFERDKKIFFFNKWVGIANCMKYQKYTGYNNIIKQQKLIQEFSTRCEPLLIKMFGTNYITILYNMIVEPKNKLEGDTPIKGVSDLYDTPINNNHNQNHNNFGKSENLLTNNYRKYKKPVSDEYGMTDQHRDIINQSSQQALHDAISGDKKHLQHPAYVAYLKEQQKK